MTPNFAALWSLVVLGGTINAAAIGYVLWTFRR